MLPPPYGKQAYCESHDSLLLQIPKIGSSMYKPLKLVTQKKHH